MGPPNEDGGDPAAQPDRPATPETGAPARKPAIPLQLTGCEPTAVPPRRVRRTATPAAEQETWFTEGLRKVAELAATGQPFQAHDLALRGLPEPVDHHRWGQLMGIARAEGIIVAVAAVPSSRPRTARSLTRLWVGTAHAQDAGAA